MSKKKWPDFLEKLKGLFSRKKKELPSNDISQEEGAGPSHLDDTTLETTNDEDQFEDEPDFTIKELKLSDLKKETAKEANPPELPPDVLPFPKKPAAPEEEFGFSNVPPVPPPPPELSDETKAPTTQNISDQDKTNKNIDLSKLQFVSDSNDKDLNDVTSPDAFQTMRVNLPEFEGNKHTPKWIKYKDAAVKSLLAFMTNTRQFVVAQIKKHDQSFNLQAKDLTWDQMVSALFSPQSRKAIHHAFIFSTVLAGTYSVGKIAAYLIKGPEKKIKMHVARVNTGAAPHIFDLASIKDANIFNVKRTPTDNINVAGNKSNEDLNKPCLVSNRPTSLPIKLVNTIVLQDSVKSIASVAVRGATTPTEVREGDKVETMAQIGKIERLRVVIKNIKSNECEFIDNFDERIKNASPITYVDAQSGKKLLDASRPKEIRNEGNKFIIKKSYRDQILQDVGNILSQARAVQLKNPDGTLSFKMTEVVPGSIYSHLNILDGDIIHHINGREITNLNDIMNMFGRIKDVDHLSISLNRGGSDIELEYDFD